MREGMIKSQRFQLLSALRLSVKKVFALAGVVQWIEHQPTNQGVAGSIPRQETCLGCGPGPQ